MGFCPLIDPRFKLETNVEVANSIAVGLSSQALSGTPAQELLTRVLN